MLKHPRVADESAVAEKFANGCIGEKAKYDGANTLWELFCSSRIADDSSGFLQTAVPASFSGVAENEAVRSEPRRGEKGARELQKSWPGRRDGEQNILRRREPTQK